MDSGGGMMGAAAGRRRSGTTDERPGTADERSGTERDSGPNGLKLSDRGWRKRTWIARKSRTPASVRWSALLGAWNSESAEREHASTPAGE